MRRAGRLLALALLRAEGAPALGDELALAQLRHVEITRQENLAAAGEHGAWFADPPANDEGFQRQPSYRSKYGFYFHTYDQPVAGVQLLRRLRGVYPSEPVYISSDGGRNFSGICAEIGNCHFEWHPPANDRWNPYPFLNRFREAARWLDAEFVVMLEPDNEVRWRARAEPQDDAGGVMDGQNAALPQRLLDYLTLQGRSASGNPDFKVKWPHFGLCGGSYFRTAAVMRAFDPDSLDWAALSELEHRRLWSSDFAMAMALLIHGYSYYPWDEVTQARYGLQPEAAIRHYGRDEGKKPGYGQRLLHEDAGLVTPANVRAASVTCMGCVWVPDTVCWEQQPVGCPTEDRYPKSQ